MLLDGLKFIYRKNYAAYVAIALPAFGSFSWVKLLIYSLKWVNQIILIIN